MTGIAAVEQATVATQNDISITADQWFAQGERVPFNPDSREIGGAAGSESIHVWQRIVLGDRPNPSATWTTFLPGFPDGSYGWAKVDQHLSHDGMAPKLFLEYVGQGDSDKPAKYPYGSMERADMVEASWKAQGVRTTFIVTFDFSSLVALELLSRQQERLERGAQLETRIEGVLMANGGLFADAHSHPWWTTPTLNSPLGGVITWTGQRLQFVANPLLKSLFSKEYQVGADELDEIYAAVSRRDGFRFLSRAAGFRPEHQAQYAERWDLRRLFLAMSDSVSFHIVGSEGDIFEPDQIVKARERLADLGLDIRTVPGGHLTTAEEPEQLARIIEEVGPDSRLPRATR
jgi:pimeloyl-ACP methyl ester carboxylesterase